MIMNTQPLEKMGLKKAEIDTYLALLKLGSSTVTPIKKEMNVHPSKIYEYLKNLSKKGLVTSIKKQKAMIYTATDPQSLLGYAEEKEREFQENKKEVEKLLPELAAMQKTIQKESLFNAQIFESAEGIKRYYELVYTKALKKGDVHYTMMVPKISNELHEGHFLHWHKYRIKKGIWIHCLYNANDRQYGQVREKMELTKVRYMKDDIVTHSYIEIFADYVGIFSLTTRENSYVMVLKDKEIAKTFRFLFEKLWKESLEK